MAIFAIAGLLAMQAAKANGSCTQTKVKNRVEFDVQCLDCLDVFVLI